MSSKVRPGSGEPVEPARAIGPAQDRALDAENVEPGFTAFDPGENVENLLATLLAHARMPEEMDPECFQLGEPARRASLQNGHGAAAAGAGLKPKKIGWNGDHAATLNRLPADFNRLARDAFDGRRRAWRASRNEPRRILTRLSHGPELSPARARGHFHASATARSTTSKADSACQNISGFLS